MKTAYVLFILAMLAAIAWLLIDMQRLEAECQARPCPIGVARMSQEIGCVCVQLPEGR